MECIGKRIVAQEKRNRTEKIVLRLESIQDGNHATTDETENLPKFPSIRPLKRDIRSILPYILKSKSFEESNAMDLWQSQKWRAFYQNYTHRSGIRIRFEKNVNANVKRSIVDLIRWVRGKYAFPMKVTIYVKEAVRVKTKDGLDACGTFFRPADRKREPYIRISTGDFLELEKKWGADDALASILWAVLHELTHYFQWLNDIELTFVGEERQATNYANRLLSEYAETREHP